MTEARERSAWNRASSLMALLANCHRDPKKTRAFRPRDFDPFVQVAAPAKVGVEVLKDVFIHRKAPGYGGPGSHQGHRQGD